MTQENLSSGGGGGVEQVKHARIQKILSTLTTFFLANEAWVDPNSTINGPSSARQRNAI